MQAFLDKIEGYQDKGLFFRNVPVQDVIDFIQSYTNEDARSPKSQTKPVLNYIDDRRLDGELDEWDVLVAEGDGPCVSLSQKISVKSEIRYPGSDTSVNCLVVGEKHRLASRGVEKMGLSEEQIERAEEDFKSDHPDKKNPSDRYYRRYRDYPLIVIHPVLMKYSDGQKKRLLEKKGATSPEAANWGDWEHSEEAYGWSISFPYTPNQTKPVNYVFNQIAINNIRADYEEESDDDYGDE